MNSWLLQLATIAALVADHEYYGFTTITPILTRNLAGSNNKVTNLKYSSSLCPDCETEIKVDLNVGKKLVSDKSTSDALIHIRGPTLTDVSISLLEDKGSDSYKPYPLVIQPKTDSSIEFLNQFLEVNRDWIDRKMVEYGAVLVRGFDVKTPEELESALLSVQPNLHNTYRGTSPRGLQGTTDFVFSAAEVPSNYPIAQHLEMSFLPELPRQVYFGAMKAPNGNVIGGETALADFRRVYQDLPKRLRAKLHQKKLLYTRTQKRHGVPNSIDVANQKGWQDLFGTSEKAEVERLAKQEGTPITKWSGRNKDVMVSEFQSQPFQLHPVTREPTWFNHAQVFHWSTFSAELLYAFGRTKDARYLFRAMTSFMASFIKYSLLHQKMALNVSFGDGTPISLLEMSQIRNAIRKNLVLNRWQQGDIVLIDNFSTSHGRQPTYATGRKIVVAWSAPEAKRDEPIVNEMTLASQWE